LYDKVAAPAYFFCRGPISPYKPKLPESRISEGVPVITGVFVLGAVGTVVVAWRFGTVVDGTAGTDVVVTGIVEVAVVDGGKVSTDVVC
jgi:hypothetical protein